MEKTIDIEKLALEVELIKTALKWSIWDHKFYGEPHVRVIIQDEGVRGVINPVPQYEEQRIGLTPEQLEILKR